MKKLKELVNGVDIKKLRKTGFFSIFLSTVFSKVLVFFGGIVIVRILSKSDYGLYAYILNVIAMLSLFNDFGATSAALQFMTEKSDDLELRSAYFKYALKIGLIASLLSVILVLLSPLYYPYTIMEAKKYTVLLSLIPFLTIIQNFIPILFRANFDNKRYGFYQFSITFINYLVLICLSIAFGVIGAIFSQYVYYISIIILGYFLCRKYIKQLNFKVNINSQKRKDFLKFSIASQINNTISGLLIIIDTFLVGLLIASPESVAVYKIGSAIPHALSFLPTCVVIYILPFFIKNNKNKDWIWSKYKVLMKYGTIIYGILVAMLLVLSKPIFFILYGDKYMDAIPIYIILVLSFFFSSSIKIPCSNIVYSMRKVKFNVIINVISIIINVISNYVFIKSFGAVGAAITTMLISILSSIAYLIYTKKLMNADKL